MSDYISREKYLQDVEHYKNQICYMSNVSMDDCIKICNEQPSADVRENIHGEWLDNHNGTFTCNKCGNKHSKSKFCSECGADMRGDNV